MLLPNDNCYSICHIRNGSIQQSNTVLLPCQLVCATPLILNVFIPPRLYRDCKPKESFRNTWDNMIGRYYGSYHYMIKMTTIKVTLYRVSQKE